MISESNKDKVQKVINQTKTMIEKTYKKEKQL